MAQKLSIYENGLAYFPLNARHSFQIVATQTMSCILMKDRKNRLLSSFYGLGNRGPQRLNDSLKRTRQFIPALREEFLVLN